MWSAEVITSGWPVISARTAAARRLTRAGDRGLAGTSVPVCVGPRGRVPIPALGRPRHRPYGGLAETENEYHPLPAADRPRGDPVDDRSAPGATCDGDDVLYHGFKTKNKSRFPFTLRPGESGRDRLRPSHITASYSSLAFNVFPTLPTYFADAAGPGQLGRRSSNRWRRA